jgi:hypothetical protein
MNQESRKHRNEGKMSECAEARKNLRKSAKICRSLSYIPVFLIDLYV